ncbi:CST complex subunit CTC1 isoform X2 [Vigna angularis]|uniref:CST complex subunit CTC1 isoform X2 n=1 Tax=Phaseolus angularis TaxID=3914 RepID=UPI0022B3DB25|nr:CST complex subunit CTC1 isoform X2 [Vigna angularis]
MDDANATVTTLAELLQSPRPVTVTATAHSVFSSTPPPHRSTTCCVLTPLPRSTVLVGTLTLPALSPPCSCLRFSDASATLCCDLLRFRPAALNREIRVTAWNFIPFKRHGCDVAHGLLEIINWRFSGTNQGSNAVDSLPLAPNCVRQSGARMRSLHGVVESVGPLFVVQCTMAASTSGLNSGSKVNLPGFSVQLVCCECRFCCSKEVLIGKLNESRKGHSFTKMEIVYFCGSASSWHPVITKLIDERVVVSGLKKKLVYLTKEESREMYVTKDESVLHVGSCSEKCMPSLKSEIKGKGECGSYIGVVKGAYMQGMVLELDHDVWLLLTDQLHTSMHGLRVGSILSVRNVHIVNPHFSWTKIIILGACIKTSIIVQSFSPCQTVVLLLVSSFRKKFDGILSDKEILGSKHKEGLVQMYASSLFPWSIFQTQQGAPVWLCTHDLNGCGRVLNCSFLKLVIPISIFICHCIHTLLRIMKSENHCKLLPIGNQFSILSREARYNGRSLRRIIQSEDVGVVLLGYLKVDPSTRRLHLVDATGGVDIVIPDLPLTWNPNEIYEVTDYEVFMDKIDEPVDQIERLGSESLSCRTIFNCSKAKRELSTPFFVCCHWKNVKCRNIPLYSCINSKNESETLEPGSYHMLRVSHKFPLQEKYSNKAGCIKSSTFVEAMLFPFILLFDGKSGIARPCNASWDKTKELSKSCLSGNNEYKFSNKRQKLVKESVSSSKEEFHTSIYELSACSNSSRKPEENRKCVNMRSSHDLSCLVTFKSLQSENEVCPAILRSALPMKDASLNSKPSRKILLEFSSDRFLKYQLLQIGDYYIIDNKRRDISGSTKDVDFGRSDSVKLLIDSGKRIWSLSFIYDENLSDHLSEYTSAKDSLSPSADGVSSNHQKLLRRSNSEPSSVSSDVCLYLPISLADVFEDNVMELEDSQSLQSVISEDSANLSLGTGTSEDRPKSCFGTQRSNSLFPEGNLMSLEGNVIEIHKTGSGFFSSCSSGANVDSLQLTGLVGTRSNFCIHVLVHHHIVNICGSVNKHTFPTGFGPGVTAVFHRILYARAQNKFMLLPVSFIVIKSIKVCDKQCGDRPSVLSSTKDADDASREYISCLISELPQGLTHKKIVFRCRVVAVLVLVIERKTTNFIAETKVNAQGTLLDIPLACFLLEDGSSSCCCWASAERAATLLRLREELTTSHHLGRILKKHKKITVKSHALSVDSPCQDHIFTVASGNALCSSDENILKFILCNACIGGIWNVVAGGMDAEETRQLGEEYLTEMLNVHNMRNMWAEEVSYPRTRAEARHMIQELLKN